MSIFYTKLSQNILTSNEYILALPDRCFVEHNNIREASLHIFKMDIRANKGPDTIRYVFSYLFFGRFLSIVNIWFVTVSVCTG